jgi:hypothetical protein
MEDIGVKIFTGSEAEEVLNPVIDDDELRRLNDIRAQQLRISTEQALETSRLLADIYNAFMRGC